jgi:hypothetical protein
MTTVREIGGDIKQRHKGSPLFLSALKGKHKEKEERSFVIRFVRAQK